MSRLRCSIIAAVLAVAGALSLAGLGYARGGGGGGGGHAGGGRGGSGHAGGGRARGARASRSFGAFHSFGASRARVGSVQRSNRGSRRSVPAGRGFAHFGPRVVGPAILNAGYGGGVYGGWGDDEMDYPNDYTPFDNALYGPAETMPYAGPVGPEQPPIGAPAVPLGGLPGTIQILVPDAQAAVWVNGKQVIARGKVRRVATPRLLPGQDYNFQVSAAWHQAGRLVNAQQTVAVSAGGTAMVYFNNPTTEAPRPR
jgi:uncharacterized protein (TIGR03000 family)